MALQTFVKINGITNLTDARYCSGMYVDLLGFTFEDGADRQVSLNTFKEISGWVSGVEFVAEFEMADAAEVKKVLAESDEIKWLEHSRIETLLAFRNQGLGLIFKCSLDELLDLGNELLRELADSEVLIHIADFKSSLTQDEQDLLKGFSHQQKIILGGGFDAATVGELIYDLALHGISMTGGDEIKPGLMDFNELADILESLELED